MFKFIKQKIKNQMWLSLCLVLGVSLLIATFCSQPMFKDGSLNKLLQQTFAKYIENNNKYPTVISKEGFYAKDEAKTVEDIEIKIQEFRSDWNNRFGDLGFVSEQTKIKIKDAGAKGAYQKRAGFYEISYIPSLMEHIEIPKGVSYEEYKDGEYYPCIISEYLMDKKNLVVGEVIEFVQLKDDNNEKLKLVVSGIYRENASEDLFWYQGPNESDREICVSKEAFDEIVAKYHVDTIYYSAFDLINYEKIESKHIDELIRNMKALSKGDDTFSCSFVDTMDKFVSQRKSINIMLWVLELPILGMVLAFIYMVSGQIMETERGEIAMLKSRGISRLQVFSIYLLKSIVIAVGGFIAGIPLGYGLCKLAASTTDFLTFNGSNIGTYRFLTDMLWYGVIATIIGTVIVMLPVIKYSKISIVEHKSSYNYGKRMFWEKCYLDIILLALSLYLVYNSNKSIDDLQLKALEGNKLDPVIFLNTCLFIVALGLFSVRLMHYLVRIVYAIGKKRWKPVSYVAFLQITRNFTKQNFITVFMILTVSLGLFNANTARTINRNNEERIEYATGADVVFSEKWATKSYRDQNGNAKLRYFEPNYLKYEGLITEGLCESYTKVLKYPATDVSAGSKVANDCMVLGIDTKDFGNTARLKDELQGETHWYNYLNALGQKSNGVIVSRNLADALGLKKGSLLHIYAYEAGSISKDKKMSFNVTDIVDAWPGYEQYYYDGGKQKERYLAVVNYATILSKFDIIPYEIWGKFKEGVSSDDVYKYLKEQELTMKSFSSSEDQIYTMKNSPEIQITNGMFTLSFVIALVLCGVGFLIYWIASIRQRELLFGVYRAMGLSVGSVNKMLVYEHIFSTFISVIQGGIVGMVSTLLFVKLFGAVYLPEKSNLDIYIYYEVADIVKLFAVIALMIFACMIVLRRLIGKMNITQALKLGED